MKRKYRNQKSKKIIKHSWNYKGGDKARECFCIDCNKKLSTSAYYKKIKRCSSCAMKNTFKTGVRKYRELNYCIDCGKELKNYKSKRCQSCYLKTIKGKNHPNFKQGKTLIEYFCIICNKKISINSALYGNHKCTFCENKTRIGNLSNNWQGGITKNPYSLEFTEELKEQIRKRDNYECQNCGMTEEEHLIVRGRILDVHHIDYDKMNCEENNLISLCNQCNLRANFNRDYWQEFYRQKMLLKILKKEEI